MAPRDHEPIAIIGSACRFPGESVTPSRLWELLRDPRDVGGPLPRSRFSAEGFHHPDPFHHGHSNVKDMRSYFLSGDSVERQFDASFFGIRAAEAAVLDPQVRLLMETTYEALEAAGQTLEGLRGSDTGCYVGMMIAEYEQSMMRDPESTGTYHVLGTARSLISNRLSYFFDWHGPCMTIDTACSSSLVAVHQAVQLLRSGGSRVAVAAGSNMIMDPVTYISESKLQMLSPDGKGRMWDADANGYARGEGVATIIMKRLCDAVADGDDIECVIRETGVNQDGKTRGITMPSASAQSALIRDTYRRAGLDPGRPADRPHYFEAHGTGTPAGDPIEAEAIHSAFFGGSKEEEARSTPLLVGSIKTVCGHAEGAAGIAGVLKASLALKHAAIPPNLLLERLNPRIEPFAGKLRVPTSLVPWPPTKADEPRRASVNNFGFGGTNAHAILESYMSTPTTKPSSLQHDLDETVFSPICFSAATETSLKRQLADFADYLDTEEGKSVKLRDLAFTLHSRRSRFPFATSVAASSVEELRSKLMEKTQGDNADVSGIVRLRSDGEASKDQRRPFILGVFTGQGAQWPAMAARLLATSPAAAATIASLEERLAQLPVDDRPAWSLRRELARAQDSRVAEAELSQPLCTAVQILLVDMLRASGVEFTAVVGHSSGEMGAAYAAGVVSASDAICIAYYRGLHTRLACGPDNRKGSMLAVGVMSEDASELVDSDVFRGRAAIAAYNSSKSLTLSGDEDAIADIQVILEDEDKFARLLKVDKAYHSHHMAPFAGPYGRSLEALDVRVSPPRCAWISTVTGSSISDDDDFLEKLRGPYWVQNAVGPVLFMQALQRVCSLPGASEMQLVMEVGPHPALQTPATQTLRETLGRTTTILYTGLLERGRDDVVSVAQGLGHVWTHLCWPPNKGEGGSGSGSGSPDLRAYDAFMSRGLPVRVVKGLPPYSWDHDVPYWHRSRLAHAILNRAKPHPLLGHVTGDSSRAHELRWRQFLSPAEMPWLNGHRLQNQSVFPAAGYVVLAIEACRELVKTRRSTTTSTTGEAAAPRARLIRVHDVDIHQAMAFDDDDSKIEAVFAINSIVDDVAKRNTITAKFTYSATSSSSSSTTNTTQHDMRGDSPLRLLASGHVEILVGLPEGRSSREGGAASPPTSSPSSLLPPRGPLADNTLPVKEADFYGSLAQLEYQYSGPFRALSGLQRKLGFVRGWVSTPYSQDQAQKQDRETEEDDEETRLLIHPATLDAAFQAVLLAQAMPYDGSLWSMHVPKTIDSISVDVEACEKVMPSAERLPFDSHQAGGARHIFKGDVDIYPPPHPPTSTPVVASNHEDHDAEDVATHAMIQVEGLHCVPFSPATAQQDKELLSVLVWDRASPDAAKAARDGSSAAWVDPEKLKLAEFLERLSFFYLQNLQRSVPLDHASRDDEHPLRPLFDLARRVEAMASSGGRWSSSSFWRGEWADDTREILAAAAEPFVDAVDYRLLNRIGENMVDIVTGKTTAIEVSMQDKLLNEYYPKALGMAESTDHLARTVKQMTHRYPHLDILEVGAGTGGATKAVLEAVGDRFASYVFTDVSSGFFPTAQEYFHHHHPSETSSRIEYKVLDISKDPVEQGFRAQGYDVVIASMVLHATAVLGQSLERARRLLRPGGWLVLNEGFDNDLARCGAIFGTFPGWWLGAQSGDGRDSGPFVSVAEWDALLRGAGFAGIDSMAPIAHPLLASNTVFVAQAVDDRVSFLRSPLSTTSLTSTLEALALAPALQDLIIVGGGRRRRRDPRTPYNVDVDVGSILGRHFRRVLVVDSLQEAAASLDTLSSTTTTVLSLCDVQGESTMKSLDEATFDAIKTVLNSVCAVLWITRGRRADDPYASMMVGMVRSLLLEIPTLSFQFLDFEDMGAMTATVLAEAVLRFRASATWDQQQQQQQQQDGVLRGEVATSASTASPPMLMTVERELVVDREGQVLIPRFIPDEDMNRRYNSARRPIGKMRNPDDSVTETEAAARVVSIRRDVQGKILCLGEERQRQTRPADHHSDSPSAVSITHSLLLACPVGDGGKAHLHLGRDSHNVPCVVLSGHLSSAASPLDESAIVPVRQEEQQTANDNHLLRTSDMAGRFLWLVAMNLVAIDVLRDLVRGERLVVFEPEPAFAAILQREAKGRGVLVDVLTSVTSRQRCELLGWSFIHPRAPSRVIDTAVASASVSVFLTCDDDHDDIGRQHGGTVVGRIISRLAKSCRVVSLAVDAFSHEASIRRLRPDDDEAAGHRPLHHAVFNAQRDLPFLSKTMTNIRLVPIAQIAEAALGDDDGASLPSPGHHVVVEWDGVDESPVNFRPIDDDNETLGVLQQKQQQQQQMFSDNKTYWLAGLTGGLGLSLCEWMVGQGARHFVITSRNPNVSASWLSHMAERSAIVKIYSNDLTNKDQTEALLRDIHAVMPPLGGVAMGAMVLNDKSFDNMSLGDMRLVTDPKVKGSAHLESLLADVDLDFFVFLSSLTAVTGNPGQSNYSAANLFMAGLAGARRRRGLAATVMHVGAILGVGYVSEKTDASKTNFSRTSGYTLTSERDFHQHFAEAVVAGRRARGWESAASGRLCGYGPLEIAMGLQKESANPEKKPFWFGNPTISHFIRNGGGTGGGSGASETATKSGSEKTSVKAQLASASSRAEALRIVKEAFRPFVCSLFQLPPDDGDGDDFSRLLLDDMGLDSLLAVEIRTWWLKTVNVNLPVMKILSGVSVDQLVAMGVDKLPSDLVANIKEDEEDGGASVPENGQPAVPAPSGESRLHTAGWPGETGQLNPHHGDDDDDTGSGAPSPSSAAESDTPFSSEPGSTLTTPPAVEVDEKQDDKRLFKVEMSRPAVSHWIEPSFSQKMFWFVLSFLDDGAGLNHTGLFRLTGPLQVDKLERAVLHLGQRHDILRTCFENLDGQPRAGIMEQSLLRLERRRILDGEQEAYRVARQLHAHSYDVAAGECLKVVLLSLASDPTTHFLLYGTHSLVLDGFSSAVLHQELLRLYQGEVAETSSVYQYSSFAQTQIQAMQTGEWEQDLDFWRTKLSPSSFPSPLPVLSVSSAVSRSEQGVYKNHEAKLHVEASTRSRVWDFCRRHKVRPFHFFLTVFRACLARFADVDDVCIGIADANRLQEGAMESLGPYVNMMPLRFPSDSQLVFEEAVRGTKETTDEALAHSAVPFQALLDDLGVPRSSTHTPIFQTFFDYRQGMPERQQWGECELEMLSLALPQVPYDLALDIIDDGRNGGCHLTLIVRQDMYSVRDAELLVRAYDRLLTAFVTSPDQVFSAPQIYETADIERALRFSQGDLLPSEWTRAYGSVLGRIESLAEEHPHSLALKSPHGGPSMTYDDMVAKSRAIGSALLSAGCRPGASVVVYQEPTPDWMCSLLGTFGVAGVCVPCDAGTVVKRLVDMVESSRAAVILVDEMTAELAAEAFGPGSRFASGTGRSVVIMRVDHIKAATSDRQPLSSFGRDGPPRRPRPEDLAMILYTSGSTGTPKGICLKHEGFTNWAEFTVPRMTKACGRHLVVLQQSSIGFDMSYLQAFLALTYGGALCIVPRAQRVDADAIARIIAAEGVTLTCAVPSEYNNWLTYGDRTVLAAGASSWKTAISGGEPGTDAVVELMAAHGPRQPDGRPPRVVHIYGPTEITFFATAGPVVLGGGDDDDDATEGQRPKAKHPLSAGVPMPNYSVYVLDDNLRPVPPGVGGEIFVGGAGVASGYLQLDNTASSDKFLRDHLALAAFASQGWTTMHRTGDRGRWRADGGLLIEGRRSGDTEHKIRGLRVDFQEVEKVILQESNGFLSEVVVSARRLTPQSPDFLVAHVRLNPTIEDARRQQTRTILSQLSSGLPLPQYMWPAIMVPVADFPRTMSGKLDRRAVAHLPLPEDMAAVDGTDKGDDDDDGNDRNTTAALSGTEARLRGIWEDVISTAVTRLHTMTSETDFFHVGGTSLLLLRLQALIHREFGLRVPLVSLFASCSLAAMARLIDDATVSTTTATTTTTTTTGLQRSAPEAPPATTTFDWHVETDIPEATLAALESSVLHQPASPSSLVVVLTGATGLLGQGYLQALVADPRVRRVHCVGVRDATARLSSLPLLGHGKVVVGEGDLRLANLGLDETRIRAVFGEADVVIHNGADTSHLKTYSSLRKANLEATRDIVDMCLSVGKRIPIHYVSTASILQYSGLREFGEMSAARYPPPADAFDGYSASKWASERFLEKIHERSAVKQRGGDGGWPVFIHRLTSVQRDGDNVPGQDAAAEEPTNMDIIWNLLKYSKLAKAVCSLPNVSGFLNMVSLEQAVESMMHSIHAGIGSGIEGHRDARGVRYLHEVGGAVVPFSDFRSFLEGLLGEPVAEVSMEAWVELAAGNGMHPVLLAFFKSLGDDSRPVTWPRLLSSLG
ncbi:Polyketide synthase-nonribosomal peptide synthetase [Colletotrichum orbiculare MAFF 240422]|uniref:Polyketide synthase-nonribosomal peptide synthetase n=1 Tax=Colletotrichum orbiculare (strain 104-T / ATCC 96160 / CBS 514.97 / LARS 414 / MAFF 240422) TaxID=1213857 RepID=N4V905_COLOR|nr:Polyketide synthase-nonribosomal peptide synthetase [Colletotrichum orbiculare MAFF 240422]